MTRRLPTSLAVFAVLFGSFALLPSLDAAADETVEVKLDTLTLQIPKSWDKQKPSSNLRLGQFEIEAVEGDKEPAELAVFKFGRSGVRANVDRWIGQFQADGRKVEVTEGKSPIGKYVLADIQGTYNRPDGPPVLRRTKPAPGYRMLGVILDGEKGGLYFFKLTGPNKTVSAASESLRKSFGGDAAKEKKFELE